MESNKSENDLVDPLTPHPKKQNKKIDKDYFIVPFRGKFLSCTLLL